MEKDESDFRDDSKKFSYLQTRCLVKTSSVKPAANPLQFIKPSNTSTNCVITQHISQNNNKISKTSSNHGLNMESDCDDWQQNLDEWKSSRRKRQNHIVERVVEIKKMFNENCDENLLKKSKTFNEIVEERNRRNTSSNISIYNYDEDNHTNTIKSSIEDTIDHNCHINNDVVDPLGNDNHCNKINDDFKKSVTEAKCTYETAIENYKLRVNNSNGNLKSNIKSSNFSIFDKCLNGEGNCQWEFNKPRLPKKHRHVAISKFCDLFETGSSTASTNVIVNSKHGDSTSYNKVTAKNELINSQSVRERLMNLEKSISDVQSKNNVKKQPIRICNDHEHTFKNDILQKFERMNYWDGNNNHPHYKSLDLICNQSFENRNLNNLSSSVDFLNTFDDTDKEDSGINMTDVSCSVSQTEDSLESEIVLSHRPHPQQPQQGCLMKSLNLNNPSDEHCNYFIDDDSADLDSNGCVGDGVRLPGSDLLMSPPSLKPLLPQRPSKYQTLPIVASSVNFFH